MFLCLCQAQLSRATMQCFTVFICIWIVVDQRGVLSSIGEKSTEPEMKYSITVTDITEFTTTVYEDPTTSNILAEDEMRETNTTGNSTFEATASGISNSSASNLPYDVSTISESQTEDKQTMTTLHMSTTSGLDGNFTSIPVPDPTHTLDLETDPTNNDKENMFSQELVYCLMGIVSLLGAVLIMCLLIKVITCKKRSKNTKRKRSWKRTKTTISDTYFTVVSGRRPPLPPRNAKKVHNDDDEEQPYHIPVLMENTHFKNPYECKSEALVYSNSEDPTNRVVPPGNYLTNDKLRNDLISTSTIIYKVENTYETTFHNNGFAQDESESNLPNQKDALSEKEPTDQESHAVKRYISMRCQPSEQDGLKRNTACSDDSSKTDIDGEQVIENYINHLLKSTDDAFQPHSPEYTIGPHSPEYNTYDSVTNHALLQNPFYFPKSTSGIIADTQSDQSFHNSNDFADLQSSNYNTFRELSKDCFPKNSEVIQNTANCDISVSKHKKTASNEQRLETHEVNELENVYTLDPTQSIELDPEDTNNTSLLQRGVSWHI